MLHQNNFHEKHIYQQIFGEKNNQHKFEEKSIE